jgi:hypothetical protein
VIEAIKGFSKIYNGFILRHLGPFQDS